MDRLILSIFLIYLVRLVSCDYMQSSLNPCDLLTDVVIFHIVSCDYMHQLCPGGTTFCYHLLNSIPSYGTHLCATGILL